MGEILLLQSSVRLNILIMTGSLFGCDYCCTTNMNSLKKGEKYTSINDLRKKFGQKKHFGVSQTILILRKPFQNYPFWCLYCGYYYCTKNTKMDLVIEVCF